MKEDFVSEIYSKLEMTKNSREVTFEAIFDKILFSIQVVLTNKAEFNCISKHELT